jgi:hypothetical protein
MIIALKPPATPHLDRVQRYRWYRGGTYEGDSLIEDEAGPLWRVDDVRAASAPELVKAKAAARKQAFTEAAAMLALCQRGFTIDVAMTYETLRRRSQGDET